MISSEATGSTAASLLASVSASSTQTGTCVDISGYEGRVVIIQNVGVVTAGSIAGKIQTGDASDGSDAADVTGATFTTVTTSNDPLTEKISLDCNALGKYIRYVGTVTTGPAVVSVSLVAKPKYVG